MKWSVDLLSISRNGQIFCPFHEMDSWVVHFMKWTISYLGHNIYTIYNVNFIFLFCLFISAATILRLLGNKTIQLNTRGKKSELGLRKQLNIDVKSTTKFYFFPLNI